MKTIPLLLLLSLLIVALDHCDGARILAVFTYANRSHYIFYTPLLLELARRGHRITIVGPYRLEVPDQQVPENIEQIVPEGFLTLIKSVTDGSVDLALEKKSHNYIFFMAHAMRTFCEFLMDNPQVNSVLEENRFDLILAGNILNDCSLIFQHQIKAPTISISTTFAAPWASFLIGNPGFYSYVPNLGLGYTDRMSFFERVYNSVYNVIMNLIHHWVCLPAMEDVYRRHFGEEPRIPFSQLERNTSLIFLNGDISVDYPRPNLPNVVELGGIHVRPPNPLPKDLRDFAEGAGEAGFIMFSMGSVVPEDKLPVNLRNAFIEAFSKIPQRVIWKWNYDEPPGLTPNVKLVKWFPQQDLLGHPNVKAFITHSGLLSSQEALYHGVPLISVPAVADQHWNAARSDARKTGVTLDLSSAQTQDILEALNKVINDTSYKENVRRWSYIMKDKPLTALQRGVFWTEYVIRHKGATHFQAAALDLYWFQVYLLDVMAFILAVTLTAVYAAWKTLCFIRNFIETPSKKKVQ